MEKLSPEDQLRDLVKSLKIQAEEVGVRRFEKALDQIDVLSKEIQDNQLIFETVVSHNTEMENFLSNEKEAALNLADKYAVIANSASDCMCLLTPNWVIEEVNQSFCEFFDHPDKTALIGKPLDTFWESSLYESVFKSGLKKVAQGKSFESQFEQKIGGDARFLELLGFPYESTGTTFAVLIFRDITEKKNLEYQLIRSQRLESIGTLAGGVAHDLNNIIAPFFMVLRTLSPKLKEDQESLKLLGMLETSAKRASDLVKQILTFARGIEGQRLQIQVKYLIQEMESYAFHSFPEKVSIQSDVAYDLWTILGDVSQVHQVLLNLIVNAKDAIESEGLVKISAENVFLTDKVLRGKKIPDGPYVRIAVSDNGVGIPSKYLERIFDPFFTTKSPDKGSGIGLSTVKAIINNHHGFMEVNSKEKEGTEFLLYFPAIDINSIEAVYEELIEGDGQHILIVDDEQSILDIMRATLENFHYTVSERSNGRQAVDFFKANAFKLSAVVIDMMMPEMTGMEAIAEIRKIRSDIPIIGITGHIFHDEKTQFNLDEDAIQALLYKPYTSEQLLNTLGELLKARQ